jgi:uncharacterized integral membrane protein
MRRFPLGSSGYQSDMATSNPDTPADVDDPTTAERAADAEPIRDYRGTGIVWGGVLVVVLAVALLMVGFQNSHDVEFNFLWIDTSAPLVLILAFTVAAAVVIDEIVGVVWRRRRRTRLRERDELKRLRSQQR